MSLKASISGIRGIIGDSLTPLVIIDYLCAFSKLIKKGKVLIGRDSRPSGQMILHLVKGILNSCGHDVVDIGIVPTPVVLFGVANGNFAGGLIITASHNPEEWNALKLVNSKGKFLSLKEFDELTAFYKEKDFQFNLYNRLGYNSEDIKIPENHINTVLNFIDKPNISRFKFKVAVDAVNGAGGNHIIEFLKQLNCEIIPVNIEPTGIFAHAPEPKPENLEMLSAAVKENDADIGFALDPDADRLVVTDENGEVLSEELTLALCILHYLKNYKKTNVVINLSTSRIIEDIAEKFQSSVTRVPTGEINVTEKMERIHSSIGGEGNGGIILREINKCRDATVGIALILEMLSKDLRKMSDIIDEFPKYVMIKEKISSKNIQYSNILGNIIVEFKGQKIDTQDGVRVDFKDKWVLFRKSNTEPIIRIFAEAKSKDDAEQLINRVKRICNIY